MAEAEPESTGRHVRRPRRRRKVVGVVATVLASLLIVIGAGLAVSTLLWPDQVEEGYGSVQGTIGDFRVHVAKEIPSARLGASGGMVQLNWCNGTFTQMLSYRTKGVPPVWAAHNDCGGDVILPLKIGDEINLKRDGSTVLYKVIDIRETPKVWVTTKRLVGLKGQLALQSCFYGGTEVPMKFVGLDRVVPATSNADGR